MTPAHAYVEKPEGLQTEAETGGNSEGSTMAIDSEQMEGSQPSKCVVVWTSNTEPKQLYHQGLNRKYFLPFVDLLLERSHVIQMSSPVDYRSKVRGLVCAVLAAWVSSLTLLVFSVS